MKLRIVLVGLLLICGFGFGACSQGENPSYTLTPLDEFIIDWKLGEEIIPYPPTGDWADCDDATLYSFYYLEGLHKDLEIEIWKGKAWYAPKMEHIWLLVSDNETTMVYDGGIPIEYPELYKGRKISLKQLISFVYQDLR